MALDTSVFGQPTGCAGNALDRVSGYSKWRPLMDNEMLISLLCVTILTLAVLAMGGAL